MQFKIIEGRPPLVERLVQEYLDQGWRLNGLCFPRIDDGYHLVVQSIVLDDPIEPEVDLHEEEHRRHDRRPRRQFAGKEPLADLIARVSGKQPDED